jgi:hypothetical protein
MSSIGIVNDGPIGLRARIASSGWIHSPLFDCAFLIMVPLLTLPIIVGIYFRIPVLAITAGVTLAFAHYFSTVAFYFWDENREYHRTRWIAFFAGPAIIICIYFLLLGFDVPYVIQIILFAWNTFHVSRQNCGILSLYRARAGVVDKGLQQRHAANRSIIASSTFLATWNLETHPQFVGFFNWLLPGANLTGGVKIVAGLAAAFFLIQLGVALLRRKEPIGIPEALFLGASLVFFWPYLFIKDSGVATYAMLLPHYVQYMTLVWLLHRRKFGNATTGAPVPLLRISSKLVYLLPVLFMVGYGINEMRVYADSRGYEWHFETFYLLVAFLHYYLDGLIWSFRQPHVRQTILPFLLGRFNRTTA